MVTLLNFPGYDENLYQLIYAAEHYHMQELIEECVDSMTKALTIENVIQALVVSKMIINSRVKIRDQEYLFDKCLHLILRWVLLIKKIMKSKFLEIMYSTGIPNSKIKRFTKTFLIQETTDEFSSSHRKALRSMHWVNNLVRKLTSLKRLNLYFI